MREVGVPDDPGLLSLDNATDHEPSMVVDITGHSNLNDEAEVVAVDGIETENLGVEEMSGETIISYSSSSVEDSFEQFQNQVGEDEDVFVEQGEEEEQDVPQLEELYDADIDSDDQDDLEQEVNKRDQNLGASSMDIEQIEPDPPPDLGIGRLGAQVVSDTQPSTSTGITAESFSELEEVTTSFKPRRSKRIRKPRKILTYTKKGEPKIESLPSHFHVEAQVPFSPGTDTPEE